VVQTYGTDEFGIVDVALTSGTQPTPFQYTGEPRDSETGLVYLRARSYDPAVGRFMQADPLRKSAAGIGGWNRYSYVGNNPATDTDPLGLCGNRACRPGSRRGGPSQAVTSAARPGELTIASMGGSSALIVPPCTQRGSNGECITLLDQIAVLAEIIGSVPAGPDILSREIRVPGPRNSAQGKVDYLLGNVTEGKSAQDSAGKGGFFRGVLGFDETNLEGTLIQHLQENSGSAIRTPSAKILAEGSLTDPNGRTANVVTVWQVREEGVIEFITAVPGR